MTLPEVLLWNALRLRPAGLKFRRQHALEPYVADFFCASARLIVEVDVVAHERGDRPVRDGQRDTELKVRGFHILRVNADEVMQDVAAVVAAIVVRAASPLHQPAAGPSPCSGEDRSSSPLARTAREASEGGGSLKHAEVSS